MNFVKRLLMVAGAVALAGIFGALLAPKAAHGIVATLVQVVNTPANPVPTAATEARNSFDVTGFCIFNLTDVCARSGTTPIYTVPSGKIAVVETFSGVCVTDNGTPVREARIEWTPNSNNVPSDTGDHRSWTVPGPGLPSPAVASFDVGSFAQNQKTYVSATSADTSINVVIFATSAQKTAEEFCTASVSGYLVSQ